jgi:putative endonuclease
VERRGGSFSRRGLKRVLTIPRCAGDVRMQTFRAAESSASESRPVRRKPLAERGFFMAYFVYVIRSIGVGSYYIGQTSDLIDRLQRHNSGMESATARYAPWLLVWHTEKPTRSEAVRLEAKLKNLSRERLEGFMRKYGGGHGGS